MPADALQQLALAALLALLSGGNARFVGEHLAACSIEVHLKFFPKVLHGLAPWQLALAANDSVRGAGDDENDPGAIHAAHLPLSRRPAKHAIQVR